MLVLTRKTREAIRIETPAGEIINVHLTRCSAGTAKIGIDAPTTCAICRAENYSAEETAARLASLAAAAAGDSDPLAEAPPSDQFPHVGEA